MFAVSVLAIALLAWFLRHANIGEVWKLIRAAHMGAILMAGSLVIVTMVIRAVRWRYLLQPVGLVRFGTAFRTTIVGFAASNVLPARAGEVLRPYLLAREEKLSATAAFATIVVERVLDMMAVVALLATFAWGTSRTGLSPALLPAIETSAALAAAAGVALLLLMWALAAHPERVGHVVLRTEGVLPSRFALVLSRAAHTFSTGLAVARAPRALAFAGVWSLILWITIGAQCWLVTSAFGIDMPFTGSFLLQALLVIGVAVPTPGAVGGFHEAYRIGATTFFHAPSDAAVGAALVLHAVSFIPVTLLGLAFMLRDGFSLRRLQGLADSVPSEEIPVAP